jgi:hypothetical protein
MENETIQKVVRQMIMSFSMEANIMAGVDMCDFTRGWDLSTE